MPLLLTVSCFSKIQIGFTFLVPAHPGSHGQRAVKRCVCVSIGDRQLQLTRALERSPSSSFVEAVESFVTWMLNAELLLASEKFVVDELQVMDHQLSQCLVS